MRCLLSWQAKKEKIKRSSLSSRDAASKLLPFLTQFLSVFARGSSKIPGCWAHPCLFPAPRGLNKYIWIWRAYFQKALNPFSIQNWVTNITTLFSLPPTLLRTHFWSEYNEKKRRYCKFNIEFPRRRVYKLAQRNAFFSEVTKVDLAPFGIKLFIYFAYNIEDEIHLLIVQVAQKKHFVIRFCLVIH